MLVTRERRRIFVDAQLVEVCLNALDRTCTKFTVDIPAYCFMPDHVHLLAVVPEGASLQDFVRHFKQLSGYELKKTTSSAPWQVSYYDRILRREEALLDVARYIWENPVEEGLADAPADYAFSGPRPFLEQT